MKDRVVTFGILGLGQIARAFAEGIQQTEGAELVAIASRSAEKLNAFGRDFHVPYRHLTYEGLAENDKVDIVYIATPHVFHAEQSVLCLQNGRGVICEKPFAVNLRQAKEMVETARAKELFLMEAMWTRFIPSFLQISDSVKNGELGEIKCIRADFGFNVPYDPNSRWYNRDLGGGAVLDIGIYPVFLALHLCGMPDTIKACAVFAPSGADESCSIIMNYDRGTTVSLLCTFGADTPTEAEIFGTRGSIKVADPWFGQTPEVTYFENRRPTRAVGYEHEGNGYNYEIAEVVRCIREGRTESEIWSLTHSLQLTQILDTIRKDAGIFYPDHDRPVTARQ